MLARHRLGENGIAVRLRSRRFINQGRRGPKSRLRTKADRMEADPEPAHPRDAPTLSRNATCMHAVKIEATSPYACGAHVPVLCHIELFNQKTTFAVPKYLLINRKFL